jgi:UDP-N-acetylglucosamine--N-acetylmuramyl-(pentapeptide) pyrophosphoryl-undecaprenol N-acetylglucosamine transferase
LIIHEQNAVAGFTNRCLANIANQVFEAFPKTFKSNIKALCSGNPVREELRQIPAPVLRYNKAGNQDRPLRLLVLGGSRGAKALNEICSRSIKKITEAQRPEIWHQAGASHDEATREAYRLDGVVARVEPFIQDMAVAYRWADLVLCRAGALTVAELSAVGVASILVPFPYAVDDHQTENARYLVEGNAAVLVQQSMLSEEKLASILIDFSIDRNKVLNFAENARKLAKDNALEDILLAFDI